MTDRGASLMQHVVHLGEPAIRGFRVPARALPRIDRVTPEQFRSEIAPAGEPVVLVGLAREWASSRWTLPWFRERYGDVEVPVKRCHGDVRLSDPLSHLPRRFSERRPLGALIDEMLEGRVPPGTNITDANLRAVGADLEADIAPIHRQLAAPPWLPEGIARRLFLDPGLWFAAPGTLTLTHFDRQENINVQITGTKRWLLFSPDQSPALYANRGGTSTALFSPCDIDLPDFDRFPRLADAVRLEATLEAGDAIFVPAGYWHHVRTIETSINVNFWWWAARCVRALARMKVGQTLCALRRSS